VPALARPASLGPPLPAQPGGSGGRAAAQARSVTFTLRGELRADEQQLTAETAFDLPSGCTAAAGQITAGALACPSHNDSWSLTVVVGDYIWRASNGTTIDEHFGLAAASAAITAGVIAYQVQEWWVSVTLHCCAAVNSRAEHATR
jgi:hypothetical protein